MASYFSYTNPCNGDINHIYNGIYISSWYTSTNIPLLNRYDIKTVINVTNNKKNSDLLEIYTKNDISDYQFHFDDDSNENIIQCFDTVYDIIEKTRSQKKNVLIHCMAGISRSSTVAAAYFMRKYRFYDASKTIVDLQKFRPIINPNSGFRKQLVTYSHIIKQMHLGEKNSKLVVSDIKTTTDTPTDDVSSNT